MLENLRRKSLVKTYIDPIDEMCFEQGLARYENHVEIDASTQRLSKELQESSFKKTIDTLSIDTRVWLRFNMIYCQKGTFTMGHIDREDNQPREETIERSFLLGETEVTQELYEKVIGKNPSHFQNRPQNPVEDVSWVDAILFCNELSKLQGLDECYTKKKNDRAVAYWDCDFSKDGYRLPERKEWEYAAKAGTENKWAGTDKEELAKYAWFGEDWQKGGSTHPVSTKAPNEWGFYDMSGNVLEWCWDKCFPDHPYPFSEERVACGGRWNDNFEGLRSASRSINPLSMHNATIGFRVCRSVVN